MPGQASIVLGVLSWNLFHGRDKPPAGSASHEQVNRPLLEEFSGWIAAREWDLALLQEAPPRWFRPFAMGAQAHGALALTSRNFGACVRGFVADLNPDLIKSGEGGSNQLLVRPPARIGSLRRITLARKPERRRMLFAEVALADGATVCVANMHATASRGDRAAAPEVERAAALAVDWAGDRPLIFGGDLNLSPRSVPVLFEALSERHGLEGPTDEGAIDHLLVRGLEQVERPRRLAARERDVPGAGGRAIRLSDHAPVVARFGMK